ncbi:PQQ-dependent sugar dehydrogenase [Cerasicoccus fimbriatus]|uniref:PQQ-dependent sugar dehydrogenase n=1 Tax=Cerasicoccus fimbriatus TaxID=3014554 RepID=UPI0022B45453|nr:PQQ-dependent sugar dehydrogenase [Cerasicoccus sp. TK19100]
MNRSLLAALPLIITGLCEAKQKVDELYAQHCQICHGEKLEGGLGKSLIDGVWRGDGSAASLTEIIRNGQPELGMPPFGEVLSKEEIRGLVIYIQEKEKYALENPPRPEPGTKDVYHVAGERFRLETVASGLSTPWSVAFLPGGRFLVTEKPGQLRIIEADGEVGPPIEGIPEVRDKGQGGLLEVALHPDVAENRWVYLSFADPKGDAQMTKIVRGRIRDNRWVDEETIFEAPEEFYTNRGHHFGNRIAFDKDNYLFFSIGDRGQQDQAQDTTRPNGKIHRIHDDGRIPKDNPFVDDGYPTIWSYGNRNAQGLDFHPETGQLWESEHGPRGGDELNVIKRGVNYGWPVITYGMNYNGTPITSETERPGMAQPVTYWTPSIAVCGIDFYEGDAFPSWKNKLLVTSLRQQELHLITLNGEEVVRDEIILEDRGRLRDVGSGPDGAVYLVLNSPDELARLVPVE